ncbi:MAG: penicillin-binding protein 2 [Candidatus Aminicenantales bacterium]
MDNKIYEDFSGLQRRSQIVFLIVEFLFLALAFYYWKVQILDHRKYWALSEANRIREVILQAPRGLLTDRTGKVILADNKASFKTSIIREDCRDYEESCEKISRLLGLEKAVLQNRIDKYKSLPLFKPIVVKDNLTVDEVAQIEARKLDLPELVIEAEPKRYYPFANLAAHIIGYMQEVSPEELRTKYKDRRLGDLVGKTGIEAQYESILAGTEGKVIEVVDSQGRVREEISRIKPKQNQKLILTLDFDLQKKAEELLEGKEGAVVVMEAKTGEILALASYPTYDPNKFINRFTPEEWLDLVSRPDHPLENRTIRGLYSPGSIFKLVMALGALEFGWITAETTFFCGGSIEIYGHPFSCWQEGGHGSLNLYEGIRNSCNIYFYNLGRRMGIDEIARAAYLLGLGTGTEIDLPGEKEGLVPSPEWKRKTRKAAWYPGETISVAIGQGPLLVTPLQIASLTAIIANRGIKVFPHLLKSWIETAGKREMVKIQRSFFENVIEGMWRSVNAGGTGRAARIEGFDVCGKTGSTQTISSEKAKKLAVQKREIKTHSWFTGLAPRDDPQIVVTVLVEYGGMGGETAAPLARRLFELYKSKYD